MISRPPAFQVLAQIGSWHLARAQGAKAWAWIRVRPPAPAKPPEPNAVRVPGLAIPFQPESEKS